MPFPFPRPALALVFALAAGAGPLTAITPTLSPAQIAGIQAQQAVRVAKAQAQMVQLSGQLNLGPGAGFVPRHVSTTPQGRTVVHFSQTYEGYRVWAGQAIAHVEPEGQVKTLTQGLKAGIALSSTQAKLSPEQAQAIALRNLAPRGEMKLAPKVEAVVFPTKFTGGLATRFDAAKGREVLDKDMSLFTKPSAEAYVLAYEVRTLLANKQDGHQEMSYIVDANTGAILRKWSELKMDAPAQGTGNSFYRGSVPLSTSSATDGTFSLVAQDRGTLPQPYFQQFGITQVGLTTCYGNIDMNAGLTGFEVYKGLNTTNSWGDGTIMPFAYDFSYVPDPNDWTRWWGATNLEFSADGLFAWLQNAQAPNGETTAVDAHYGLSTTWDFYRNVFGRNGIDDQGTSTFGVVHAIDANWFGIYPMYDNAYWAPWYFGMVFGDGTEGTPWAEGSYGMKALTEIDVTGHELTHGVTEYSAGLIYSEQSGGINEATSDILGKMVQAYADGGTQGASIPSFPTGDLTKWEVARHSVNPAMGPLRYMYKPSLDHASADGWYDGIELIDVHFSSGPVNRFYFFLTSGASSNPSSLSYSPYYPAGMNGIGNDKAAHLYYKALTEYMPSDADYLAARTATISAAQDLFGPGSPEELAVMQAWSAVNVGLAPGQAPRPTVTFPVINGAGSFLDANAVPTGILKKVQIFPTSTPVKISVNVENSANTAVDFTTPSWHGYAPAGTIQPDGTWTTPNWPYYEDLLNVKASSQADASQFAMNRVLLVDLDCDLDNEIDALDLGTTAMSWSKPGSGFQTPHESARIAGGWDWDLVFFTQAFTNGFPVK
ncbi:MAG TPA: M4 family metallopeptidase [Geothrix sp.]|nr:M4 family metallopeptidase [Geothrix sp.]